jgi:hypothetical protein
LIQIHRGYCCGIFFWIFNPLTVKSLWIDWNKWRINCFELAQRETSLSKPLDSLKSITTHTMNLTRIPLTLGLALASIASLQAAAIVPAFTTFGTLPGATFGGSGIPNDQVAITTLAVNQGTLTLGLTAHQRYSNPTVTNNGAGVYSAVAGGDTFSGANSNSNYARWNVGVYAVFDGTQGLAGHTVSYYYDTDPAVGNDVPTFFAPLPLGQDSTNLGFGFYGGAAATNGIDFDPNVDGEYSFALVVRNAAGAEVGRSAINVRVGNPGTVPDGGVTAVLLGLSMLGVAGLKRKFQA